MKSAILTVFLIIVSVLTTLAQTVNVQYLNPKFGNGNPYTYMRFGSPTEYYAGFMWNNSNPAYGDGNDFSIFTYGNRDLTIRTGSGNFIVFPSVGGNMGVGITNPTHKLEVNGTIRAKEVKLEASNWPDYVFEEGYELMSLGEVEAFIDENGHLPGMKSAEAYQEEGVNMLELNQKLLEKVEELTLHTIAQEKELLLLREGQKLLQSKVLGQERELEYLKEKFKEIIQNLENDE